jgi:hypothetical protein
MYAHAEILSSIYVTIDKYFLNVLGLFTSDRWLYQWLIVFVFLFTAYVLLPNTQRQQNVTIFRSLFWWNGLNIKKNYAVSAARCYSIFTFHTYKLHLLIDLCGIQLHSYNRQWKLTIIAKKHTTHPQCCSKLITVVFWISRSFVAHEGWKSTSGSKLESQW